MKRFVLPVVAALVLGFAPAAAAQVVVPPGGEATVGTPGVRAERTPRIAGAPRESRTERVPGTGRTPGTARTPRTHPDGHRHPVTQPRTLPRTGNPAAALAVDGAALLGAGLVLMRTRRRLLA